jgi:hypothetical protein
MSVYHGLLDPYCGKERGQQSSVQGRGLTVHGEGDGGDGDEEGRCVDVHAAERRDHGGASEDEHSRHDNCRGVEARIMIGGGPAKWACTPGCTRRDHIDGQRSNSCQGTTVVVGGGAHAW